MQYELRRDGRCAQASLQGLALLEGWQAVLPELGRQTAQAGDARLLLVLHGLVGWLGQPERQKVGELAAQHLRHLERIAFLVPPHKVSGVTQAAARERGLDLRVFSSEAEARAWLDG